MPLLHAIFSRISGICLNNIFSLTKKENPPETKSGFGFFFDLQLLISSDSLILLNQLTIFVESIKIKSK